MTADAIGGVWQYSLELARGLTGRGVAVTLAVLGSGFSAAKRAEALRLGIPVFEHSGKLEWMDSPWNDVRLSGEWLLRLADQVGADVIHLNGYAHAVLPWDRPVIVVAHSCVLSWYGSVRNREAPSSFDAYRKAVQNGLQAANLVIAPSCFMRDALVCNYGPVRDVRVIWNGRNPECFQPGPKDAFILAAGRVWDEAKNFQVLDHAATRVHWPVYLAGESQHPEGGHAMMSGLHLLEALEAADLARWYARASIYALPALYEPFGLTVLEAALSGCALVLSDLPSFREIWGDAACYVSPRDAGSWEKQLNALGADPERQGALAHRARNRGLELSAGRMTVQYLAAYQHVQSYRPCESLSSLIPSDRIGTMETPTSSAA